MTSGIIMNTQIAFMRNFSAYAFPIMMTYQASEAVYDLVMTSLDGGWLSRNKFEDMTEQALVQWVKEWPLDVSSLNHMICRGSALHCNGKMALMVNADDHLFLVGKSEGLALFQLRDTLMTALNKIENMAEIAFDPNYGFLTSRIQDVGIGLGGKVRLHLPFLASATPERLVFLAAQMKDVALNPLFETTESAFYVLSNRFTLGVDQDEVLDALQNVAIELMREEYDLRRSRLKSQRLMVEDGVFRALGLAQYARVVSFEEVVHVLSQLRLGVECDMIDHPMGEKIDHAIMTLLSESDLGFQSKSKHHMRGIRYAHILKGLLT